MGKRLSKVRHDKLHCQQKPIESQANSIIAATAVILNDELLVQMIDIETGLLRDLRSHHVIDEQQVQLIQVEQTTNSKISRLIAIIQEQSNQQQVEFLSVLDKYHQSHVANYIRSKGHRPKPDDDDWPLVASSILWSEIDEHWHQLVDLIESSDYFLDELLSTECVTRRQEQKISRLKVRHERNEMFLNILRRRSIRAYNEFINALMKTNQSHVVSLLEPDFLGGDMFPPLDPHQRSGLDSNRPALIEMIDTKNTGLLDNLLSVGCITQHQYANLSVAKTNSEASRSLLDSIISGSQLNLSKFIRCLNRTGQEHVSRIILEGGDSTLLDIDAKTSLSEDEEAQIVERFRTLLRECETFRSRAVPQINTLYEALDDGSRLIAMKTEHSIKLFILCKSLLGLFNLHMMYFDGQLKTLFQELFAALLENKSTVAIDELTWDMKDYVVRAERLSNLMGLPKYTRIYQLALQTYDDDDDDLPDLNIVLSFEEFPPELMEVMIFRAAAYLFAIGSKLTTRADVYLFVTLSAVNCNWWNTLKLRKYKKASFKRYCERMFQPYKFNSQLVNSIPTKNVVQAIAEFNGKLFVKLQMSGTIQVFDASSHCDEHVDEYKLPTVMDANIVICNYTKYLFIIAYFPPNDSKNVWRINLISGGAVEEFSTTLYFVRNASVHCGRLLITPDSSHNINAIYLYNEVGQLDKRIRLPKDMEALNSIETANETFVIICTNRGPHRSSQASIRELSDEGLVLRECSSAVQLSITSYLTKDANNFILFSDDQNKQILLLNPDLELERFLLQMQLDEIVHKLFYSQQTGNLYVCCYSHVNIFKLASFN